MHARSGDALPATPSELTRVLRESGTLHRGSISGVSTTLELDTSVSHLRFLEITCSPDAAPDLPGRLLLKWPLPQSVAPDQGAPELNFYRELAPLLDSPPVVRCLATAPVTAPQRWLLLEDLRLSHTNPPWPERPADRDVEGAVSVLASVHARWWEAPSLGSTIGTLHTEAGLRDMVHGIARHLPGFLDNLKDSLAPGDHRAMETVFGSSLGPWLRLLDRRALTVVHGDAHTWNFLFPRSGKGLPYLIDWQTWHPDVGARDLAFLIALHWTPAIRRVLEQPLLRRYHQQLVHQGITDYPFEDLWLDYRRCVVRNLTFPIILWSRGLHPEAWRHRLDCALAAYHELQGEELL